MSRSLVPVDWYQRAATVYWYQPLVPETSQCDICLSVLRDGMAWTAWCIVIIDMCCVVAAPAVLRDSVMYTCMSSYCPAICSLCMAPRTEEGLCTSAFVTFTDSAQMIFIRSDQSMVMLLMVEISSYDAMSDKQQLPFCMRRHCYSVWWRILIEVWCGNVQNGCLKFICFPSFRL